MAATSDALAVHEHGDPDAPTLLLLHGITDSGECWTDLVERLAGSYRIVAPDALGHGGSARFTPEQLASPDPVEAMHAAAEALLADLVAQQGSPVLALGHSMGGATAATLAARRPDLVRAVVLEEPAWIEESVWAAAQTTTHERVADAEATALDPAGAIRRCRVEHPTWPESELAAWAQAKADVDLAFLATGRAVVATPWQDVAAAIERPTLVVTGDGQVILGPRTLAQVEALGNDRLEVHVVAGADHCVRRDRGDAFHALVDPWLARHA